MALFFPMPHMKKNTAKPTSPARTTPIPNSPFFIPAKLPLTKCSRNSSTLIMRNPVWNREEEPRLPTDCFARGLLERAAHIARVAVREIRALHHQDVSHTLLRIHPCLGAPCPAMPETSGRKHFG